MGAGNTAELILTGAPVYTVDAARPWAGALAIAGGRIAAVGTEAEVRELASARTEVVELDGGLVLPGFQDAHVHALHGALSWMRCDLHEATTRAAVLDAVAAYAAAHPGLEWIVGEGWGRNLFERGLPHRDMLDAVVDDRPVFLLDRDEHVGWANSRALERAGIDSSSVDPQGGRIERAPDGAPTGILHEHAKDAVQSLCPEPSAEEHVEALTRGQAYLHSLGITSWQDPWITEPELQAYRTLCERGDLTARVVLALLWERDAGRDQIERLRDQRSRATLGRLRASTAKIFQDGIVENFTAALLGPYFDSEGGVTSNSGLSMIEPERLRREVALLEAEGFQVHVHAIGDRAVRETLDAFEGARAANGPGDHRHHIAHIQVVDPADIPRFGSLGVVANAQPLWACNEVDMTELTMPFLGPERSAHQYPFGSLHRAGATLAFGSDWPVSTPDPLAEIEVAVRRVSPEDRAAEPFLPQESVDLETAVAAFTINSAYVNRQEAVTGSLEPGKLADVVVLDRNIFEPSSGPPGDARVVLTLVDGSPVFGAKLR